MIHSLASSRALNDGILEYIPDASLLAAHCASCGVPRLATIAVVDDTEQCAA